MGCRAVTLLLLLIGFAHAWCYRFQSRLEVLRRINGILSCQEKSLLTNGGSSSFRHMQGLPDWLIEGCENMGYYNPTLTQALAIPNVLAGKDVILQAQTGSGKTLAYSLPILARIDPSRAAIQAVVMVPTRELGMQVASVIKQLSAASPRKISIMSIVEGSSNRRQQLWAVADPPHIVVGNPLAIRCIVDTGKLRLNAVNFVVVDEVDACMSGADSRQEFHQLLSRHLSSTYIDADEVTEQESIRRYVGDSTFKDLGRPSESSMSYCGSRQTIFCSATIPQRHHFAASCQTNGWTETQPEIINVSKDNPIPASIDHQAFLCEAQDRQSLMMYLLKQELSAAQASSFKAIVFANDEHQLPVYYDTISRTVGGDSECAVSCLTKSMDIDSRRISMENFRAHNKCSVLVCSELGARGLDIPETSLVIQVSLPRTANEYLHRAGRTGRLFRKGKVITLMQPAEMFVLRRYMNELGFEAKIQSVKSQTQ